MPGADDLILVLACRDGQGARAREALAAAGLATAACPSMEALLERLGEGVGAIVLPQEELPPGAARALLDALSSQPAWSDLPVVVLQGVPPPGPGQTDGGQAAGGEPAGGEAAGGLAGGVLCRIANPSSLLDAVDAALKARRRQYRMRDELAAREVAAERARESELRLLERVAERAAWAERQATHLQALALELSQTELRERRRLAQLLHDQLQQSLVAAKLTVGGLTRRAADTRTRGALETVQRLLQQSIDASRTLALELSPPVLAEGGLIAGLRWLVRWMEERHGLEVALHVDERTEPGQPELRMLLFQCARELLTNVVQHAGVARALVRLEPGPDDHLSLEVCDTGAGFDPDAAPGRDGDGQLGLLGIRDRIRWFGGEMHIDSAPGSGTRVRLLTPVRHGAEPAPLRPPQPPAAFREAEVAPAAPTQAASAGDGLVRVIIADDHEIVRDGLAELLGEAAWIEVVGEAADGLEAVALAHRDHPDVVVMDVTMPRLSGIEATRRIRAELPDVQVVGLSMHDHAEMATALERAGAAAYLTKGGAADDLFRAIRNAAARGRAERAEA